MISIEQIHSETNFSKELIEQQLQKMFSDPIFAVSDILKRFLSFIVDETFAGHSNQLKEYTIGVKVLNKPATFNPQQDSVVRIHAGRLRRALHQYYKDAGAGEPIRISIPKGSYIPFFCDTAETFPEEINTVYHESVLPYKPRTIGVIPFRHFEKDAMKVLFADGLGVQLTTAFSTFKNISVIAYYTMRQLAERIPDIRELAAAVAAKYVITGDIQSQRDRTRINVQLINTETSEQISSQMHECRLKASNVFDVQDKVVGQVTSMLEDHLGLVQEKVRERSMIAVA